jgi:cytochrome P450 PksS
MLQAWFVTRHDDVMNCLRDSRLSADRSQFIVHQVQRFGMDPSEVPELIASTRLQMVNRDGAPHLRLRRQTSPGFMLSVLDAWRPAIRRMVETLVEPLLPQRQMELVRELSNRLPVLVISELLEIPVEGRERFQQWGTPIGQFFSPQPGQNPAELARQANQAMREASAYLADTFKQRRQSSGQDVLSQMLLLQEQGGMSREELIANTVLIFSAGHFTTTDQISNAIHDLLTHPEEFQKLRENPSLMKSAVEEVIRYTSPTTITHRIAAEDFTLRGQNIRKGQLLLLVLASANRDPGVIPDPDRFDITRDHLHQRHMSFGFGPHHCLGAGLARRELECLLEVVIERMPGLRLDEEHPPQPKRDMLFRGFESLHVRW